MSRKYNESDKPCRCKDCEGFCPEDVCVTRNAKIENPSGWRYCCYYRKHSIDEKK